ncbi:unnamed protein product [Effrenium voratum]|nr:unnamed protein product [Effrenium voratum]
MGAGCLTSQRTEPVHQTQALDEKPVTQPEQIWVVHQDDTLEKRDGPAQAQPGEEASHALSHAPVVILDVGKGLQGIKAAFFRLFPRGKFLSVSQFFSERHLLGHCIVLLHGGGNHKDYLGETEKEKLIEHLRQGGSLMTISAAGTFCGCNRGSWSLLPVAAHDRQHWQRGTGEVKLKLTAYGEDLLPGFKGVEIESKYYNSPLLLPIATDGQAGCSQLELAQPVVPVLTYQTEMNECQAARSLVGMPAVLVGEFQPSRGRFVAISPNLEVAPKDSALLLFQQLACWASASDQLRAAAGTLAPALALEGPFADEAFVAGTDRDGGALYRIDHPSAYPALSEEAQSVTGKDFSLPGECRLVIVDLGKGSDQLQEIFSPLVPSDDQRVVVSPTELPDIVSPGDVIFLHGGMANEHAERLGVLGRAAIRRHLLNGGGVMGVCAGAHWLSCRDLPLWGHILPAVPHDNKDWRRGVGEVSVSFTREGRRMLGLEERSMRLRYANGPLLVALHMESYENYQPGRLGREEEPSDEPNLSAAMGMVPLAFFSDCADPEIKGWPSMKGHSAAWAWCTSSGGRVIALSPHPEYHQTPHSRLLFRRSLLWCASASPG